MAKQDCCRSGCHVSLTLHFCKLLPCSLYSLVRFPWCETEKENNPIVLATTGIPILSPRFLDAAIFGMGRCSKQHC